MILLHSTIDRRGILLALFVLLLAGSTSLPAHAQSKGDGSTLLGSNAEGTHFMVGFMQNEILGSGSAFQTLQLASRFACTVRIITSEQDTTVVAMKPYAVTTIQVDPFFECVNEGIQQKAIEIISTRPISVYGFSSKLQTSDGYLALPVNSWGTSYVTANYRLDTYAGTAAKPGLYDSVPRPSEFAVIASENNTVVTVYPATATLGGAPKGGAYSVTLNKWDIFQVQDGASGIYRGYTDLTGSFVTSSKPVGVLSGHVRTTVPIIPNNFNRALEGSKDHIIEMLPPRNTLGKQYIAVPFGGREGGDVIRVISSEPGTTTVTFANASGTTTRTISTLGGFLEYDLFDVTVISADHPVLVAQYARSEAADPRNVDGDQSNDVPFDPDLLIVTPQEQFVNAAVFQTMPNVSLLSGRKQFDNHYVTIVAERDKFSTIQIDGQTLATQVGLATGVVPTLPQYQWATLKISDGKIHVLNGDGLFGGYVYGLGAVDSYAWPVGAGLRKSDVSELDPPVIASRKVCGAYEITVTDSGATQSGLLNIWLDSANSDNARFDKGILIRGDEIAVGSLTLIDPTKTGHARIIAEDLSHNRDTIELTLSRSLLTLTPDNILIAPVLPKQIDRRVLTLKNEGDDPILIDSVVLAKGIPFSLDPYPIKAYRLGPGMSLQITVYFYSEVAKSYEDTVIVSAECMRYTIPVRAAMPAPSIATHDLDYGMLRIGSKRCMNLVVRNPGLGTLRIDSVHFSGGVYESTDLPLAKPIEVPGGDSVVFVICFDPKDTGIVNGWVDFFSNIDTVPRSHLVGRGIYPLLTIGGHEFGDVEVGDTVCALLPIANIGSDTAHLTDLTLPASGFLPDRSIFPIDLPPGDTLWVRVCFTPDAEREFTGDVTGGRTDVLTPEPKNAVHGVGYVLTATIGSCDWLERRIDSTSDSTVYIVNHSTHPIDISEVWLSAGDLGDFLVDPLLLVTTIPAGDSLPVKVHFTPMLAGVRSALVSARTSARGKDSVISGILTGFALMAVARDTADFDARLAYACEVRHGQITIYNDGNMPLTLDSVTMQATADPGVLTLNAPKPKYVIPQGDSVVVDFTCDFGGRETSASWTISWSFREIPLQVFSRSFALESRHQIYYLSAMAPATVALGDELDLNVTVDSASWKNLPQGSVQLEVTYNPTTARFDRDRWSAMVADAIAKGTLVWAPKADPVIAKAGKVVLEFVPIRNLDTPLDQVTFLTLPFRGYLGNSQTDTFRVTMTAGSGQCSPPVLASAPYGLDSLCGLSTRLFEFTGSAYKLDQNTPNPFAQVTEISFTLGMEAATRLEIYSADGRMVRLLVDETLSAGEYRIPLVTEELASGLYYYRLTSGPFSAIRTMLIAK